MNIEKIHIENYKGIKSLDLELHPRLNVFIGDNASGKTSLLQAIFKSCVSLTQRLTPPRLKDSSVINFSNSDVNNFSRFLQINTTISILSKKLELFLVYGKYPEEIQKKIRNNNIDISNRFTTVISKKIKETEFTIPMLKFYPANRGAITNSNSYSNNSIYQIPQLEAWANVYQDEVSYPKFFTWFFEHETQELRLKRDSNDLNTQSPILKGVRKALNTFFFELQGKDYNIKSDQYKKTGTNVLIPSLVLENRNDKNDKAFIDSKSDGEKAIIALVADIAYNLSIAHDFSESENYLESKGIVIIDEIETHLHPTWQRKILELLTAVFPGIQFIVSTHSPQVLSSVKSESIFVSENFEFKNIGFKTKGLDSNSILKYIFDSTDRPKYLIKKIEEFDNEIDNETPSIEKLNQIISEVKEYENEDSGRVTNDLSSELELRLEAYKFELENEEDL
ncbi:AAA family ATPase [Aquimarina algiphila]|uniref:AAA family ATPase n=1 Tax=Aquimarina algiphila TaxID=2047982 RepID=UPI00248FAE85|nr:AAA family ATPase [Aquimarina algiphila]